MHLTNNLVGQVSGVSFSYTFHPIVMPVLAIDDGVVEIDLQGKAL